MLKAQSGIDRSWTSPETCSQRLFLTLAQVDSYPFLLSALNCLRNFLLRKIYSAGSQEPRMGRWKVNIFSVVVESMRMFVSVSLLPLEIGSGRGLRTLRTKKPGGVTEYKVKVVEGGRGCTRYHNSMI